MKETERTALFRLDQEASGLKNNLPGGQKPDAECPNALSEEQKPAPALIRQDGSAERPVEGIIAVSGGPDSMCLLAGLTEQGHRLAAAHVNYHARDTAGRDEKIVREFCVRHHLPFHKIDVHYQPDSGNFQAWAREVRYQFFEELADQYGVCVLYTGHQMDDHMETYLMQKERESVPEVYGLEPESQRGKLIIRRPLLGWSKKQCEAWNAEHGIAWGLDESNLQDRYRRNQIRHSVIDSLSEADKARLQEEIGQANQALQARKQRAKDLLDSCSADPVTGLVNYQEILEDEDAWFLLEQLMYSRTGLHHGRKELLDWTEQLKSGYACFVLKDVSRQTWLLESYRHVLTLQKKPEPFSVSADSLEMLVSAPVHQALLNHGTDCRLLVTEPSSGLSSSAAASASAVPDVSGGKSVRLRDCVWVQPEDFPLIIRTARESDEIAMRFGHKKLSRYFIDRQMNMAERSACFVAENRSGQVIFVSGLGCDRNHFKSGTGLVLSACGAECTV